MTLASDSPINFTLDDTLTLTGADVIDPCLIDPDSTDSKDSVSRADQVNGSLQSHGLDDHTQRALSMIEPELVESLNRVAAQLDNLIDLSLGEKLRTESLIKRLADQLDEIAGVFKILELPAAADLSAHLRAAIAKVSEQTPIDPDKIHQALFKSTYLLPRYFEYVAVTGEKTPLLLAPCFYSLASAGLSRFVDESELLGVEFTVRPSVLDASTLSYESQQTETEANNDDPTSVFRRLRHMYQTGLIGLLKDNQVDAKLALIERVVSRCINLCSDTPMAYVWKFLAEYLVAIRESRLEFTPQRKHFFAKFDRCLKQLEIDPTEAMKSLPNAAVLNELITLLMLSKPSDTLQQEIADFGDFPRLTLSDGELIKHREAMERSTHKALLAMLEAIGGELEGAKGILDSMSESGICEPADVDGLLKVCGQISAVLSLSGFDKASDSINKALESISLWRETAPDQEDLLEIANLMLYIENAMLTGSLMYQDWDDAAHDTVVKGLLQNAQLELYKEAKNNLHLAKRAVSSYIESDFDREHIAYVSRSLEAVAGAFNMIEISSVEELMSLCAQSVQREYELHSEECATTFENLADALVSCEYLLDELSSGRLMDARTAQLIDESLGVLRSPHS